MKSAVTFLVVTVFTTLFLESSTVPVEPTAVTKGWQLLSDVIGVDEVSTHTRNTRSIGIVTGNIFGSIKAITDKIISDVGKTVSIVGETVNNVVAGTTNIVDKVANDVKTAIDNVNKVVTELVVKDVTAKQALSTLAKYKAALASSILPGDIKLVFGNALSDSDTELFKKLLGEFVANRVVSSEEALSEVTKKLDEALKKAKGPENATLTEVNNWLIELVPELNVLHSDTLAAVANGTKKDLGNVIQRLSETIEQRTPEVAKYIALLGATPGKQTSSYLVIFTDNFALISTNANLELQALRLFKIVASY